MTRTGTIASGSSVITVLRRTSDLAVGMAVYGTGIPVNTKIVSIDSDSQVTVDRNATAPGAQSLEFTNALVGVYQERVCAQADAKDIIDERGDIMQLFFRTEANVSRDRYSSIKKRNQETVYTLRVHPVTFNPSDKQLEKAGLREASDVVVYTAMKDWIDLGIDFADIRMDLKLTVHLQGEVYVMRYKGLSGQFNDSYLYITFGLFKR